MNEIMIAVLDEQGCLIGTRMGIPVQGDVTLPDDCDLPLDGTYKWMEEHAAFVPLGHGFPRAPSRPPVSIERVVYLMAMEMADRLPAEVVAWAGWYAEHFQQRADAAQKARRIRRGR